MLRFTRITVKQDGISIDGKGAGANVIRRYSIMITTRMETINAVPFPISQKKEGHAVSHPRRTLTRKNVASEKDNFINACSNKIDLFIYL